MVKLLPPGGRKRLTLSSRVSLQDAVIVYVAARLLPLSCTHVRFCCYTCIMLCMYYLTDYSRIPEPTYRWTWIVRPFPLWRRADVLPIKVEDDLADSQLLSDDVESSGGQDKRGSRLKRQGYPLGLGAAIATGIFGGDRIDSLEKLEGALINAAKNSQVQTFRKPTAVEMMCSNHEGYQLIAVLESITGVWHLNGPRWNMQILGWMLNPVCKKPESWTSKFPAIKCCLQAAVFSLKSAWDSCAMQVLSWALCTLLQTT